MWNSTEVQNLVLNLSGAGYCGYTDFCIPGCCSNADDTKIDFVTKYMIHSDALCFSPTAKQ